MPKKHADDASVIRYRIKPPETWKLIREEWEAGKGSTQLGKLFDVAPPTIETRRRREGWTRATPMERLTAPAAVHIDALAIAEAALARALEALALGRAADAMSLIKAGDAVGAFADFVARLRAEASGRAEKGEAAEPGPP